MFLNCPFDDRYQHLFRALVFTIHECGFWARCALETEDSGEERIRRIKRIIRECRYGIHDLSRVELDEVSQLPRFNVPLELGLFLGAQEYGPHTQNRKRSLVLDAERYRYQQSCSDIAGQDVRAHENDSAKLIAAVRAMLSTTLGGQAILPGPGTIRTRFDRFDADLPAVSGRLRVRVMELQFVELRFLVIRWLTRNPL